MTRTTLQTLLVVGMVLLAGCAGGLSGTPTTAPDADGDGTTGGDGGTGSGTVAMYISDQPAAIEDFEHLNVTITSIGFKQAGSDDDNEAPETETDDDTPETETPTPESGTATPTPESGTATPTPASGTATPTPASGTDDDTPESDESDDDSGGWVEHDVDNRTVDLTELIGANASLLGEYEVPNGTYSTVFVYVSDVNATLDTGEQVNVKLPSSKLHINKPFTVGDGESVDFVFDIAVHKAGNSGKYVLRPVIGESGTDVPINRVDDDDDRDDRAGENALNASFVGEVAPGENATVEVTMAGERIDNATVSVNGEQVGATNADGRLTFAVPDGEQLEVEIRHGDAETELEREFEDEADDDPGNQARTPTPTAAT